MSSGGLGHRSPLIIQRETRRGIRGARLIGLANPAACARALTGAPGLFCDGVRLAAACVAPQQETKARRSLGDSNPCGQSPMDF